MLQYNSHSFSILYLIIGLICFTPPASYAADYNHGDACSAAGAFHQTNDASGLDLLICDGSNWKSVLFFSSAGNNLRLDNDPAAGGAGCFKYNGTSSKLQFSHNCSSYVDLGFGGSSIIDGIAAAGITIDAVTITNTSNKWPDYILCNDGTSKNVLRLRFYEPSSGSNSVRYQDGGGDWYQFAANGTYNSRNSVDANCGASGSDINSICNANRCFFAGGGGDGGGGTPGGSDTQIQFNSGGSAFGGDADFVWNNTTNKLTVTGDIDYTGVITDISDRRLKENITPLANSLEGILALQGYSFTMKDDPKDTIEYGLIAQDVQEVFPHLVARKPDGTMALNYMGLSAPLIEAIKEQHALIESQAAKIETLVKQNETFEARLIVLEEQLGTRVSAPQ